MRALALVPVLALLAACDQDTNTTPFQPANVPPIADASRLADGSLDGRASWDPDGDADTVLTYHWAFDYQPVGSQLTSSAFHPNHDTTGVTRFEPDAEGTWIVTLEVDDGEDLSEPVTVFFDTTYTDYPEVDAGPDMEAEVGETVLLDGSGSLGSGTLLLAQWTLDKVPADSILSLGSASITEADSLRASFVPDALGLYVASLTLTDSQGASSSDTVSIMVSDAGEPPQAQAGDDQAVDDCTLVELDGTGSFDPEGATLSWFWELQERPDGSLADNYSFTDRTSAQPSFWPDVAGEYVLSLSVWDGNAWSDPDLITVSASERPYNSTPTVDAGADRLEAAGEAECTQNSATGWRCGDCDTLRVDMGLDALVEDKDGDPLEITWTTVDEQARFIHTDRVATELVIDGHSPEEPGACEVEAYTFELSARDCPGAVGIDFVKIEVECCGVEG